MLGNLGLLEHQLGNHRLARSYSQQALDMSIEMGDNRAQGNALTYLGHALAGLDQLDEARKVYQRARNLYQQSGQLHLAMEPLAGLAEVDFCSGRLRDSFDSTETIFAYLQNHRLDGTSEPFRVYLTCYRILKAHHDTRAYTVLHHALEVLCEQAQRIGNPDQISVYLTRVTHHRMLLTEAQREHVPCPDIGIDMTQFNSEKMVNGDQ
ncbi:MAG: tetratricopeptide repeat protein [Chloroflexaceae bacterium]|nr:tetratricopeptide repeat protein [Chloroflexaceae bacterium]